MRLRIAGVTRLYSHDAELYDIGRTRGARAPGFKAVGIDTTENKGARWETTGSVFGPPAEPR
jgi:hypothetical protein